MVFIPISWLCVQLKLHTLVCGITLLHPAIQKLSVCVNQGGTNHNRCTNLHIETCNPTSGSGYFSPRRSSFHPNMPLDILHRHSSANFPHWILHRLTSLPLSPTLDSSSRTCLPQKIPKYLNFSALVTVSMLMSPRKKDLCKTKNNGIVVVEALFHSHTHLAAVHSTVWHILLHTCFW